MIHYPCRNRAVRASSSLRWWALLVARSSLVSQYPSDFIPICHGAWAFIGSLTLFNHPNWDIPSQASPSVRLISASQLYRSLPSPFASNNSRSCTTSEKECRRALSVASAGVWTYLAYRSYDSGTTACKQQGAVASKSLLYSLAAAATASVLLYTVVIIMPTNKDLMKLNRTAGVTGAASMSEAEVKALLKSWNSMNYVRAVLPMLGSLMGLYAVIS